MGRRTKLREDVNHGIGKNRDEQHANRECAVRLALDLCGGEASHLLVHLLLRGLFPPLVNCIKGGRTVTVDDKWRGRHCVLVRFSQRV